MHPQHKSRVQCTPKTKRLATALGIGMKHFMNKLTRFKELGFEVSRRTQEIRKTKAMIPPTRRRLYIQLTPIFDAVRRTGSWTRKLGARWGNLE